MNHDKLKEQLIVDEGYRTGVYRDTEGNLTVGIGHLILPSDNLHYGESITTKQVDDFFEHDLIHAEIGCRQLINNFDSLPDDIQDVCINMCFNLGATHFSGFKKFIAALGKKDYLAAAEEMKMSIWWDEVGRRAERLQTVLINYANEIGEA